MFEWYTLMTMGSEDASSVSAIDVVVDVDFHITDDRTDIAPYLPEPFDQLMGYPEWTTVEVYAPNEKVSHSFASGRQVSDLAKDVDVLDGEAIRNGMGRVSAESVLLTPTGALNLGCVFNDQLAAALATAYNEMVSSEYGHLGGVYSPILVAPQRPEKAADEIAQRSDDDLFKAVLLPSGGVSPMLGDRKYWPIFEAAEDRGLPVVLHASTGTAVHHFPAIFEGMSHPFEQQSFTQPMIQMSHFTSLLMQGVPEVFDLDIVFQEASLGWVPYMMHRIDHEYAIMEEDAPMLTKQPSEYVRDDFYFTSQPFEGLTSPGYARWILETIHADQTLLYASSYPHSAADHADELLGVLSECYDRETVEDIFANRAVEIFDL